MTEREQRNQELRDNYAKTLSEIRRLEEQYDRDPDSIRLVAVSKTYPVNEIAVIADEGQLIFAENRVQDLTMKIQLFRDLFPDKNIEWHMIGTLQRNKVRQVVGEVALIHSVHSLSILKEIQKRAKQQDIVQDILLQLDISGEETKHGFDETELQDALRYLEDAAPNVRLKGFMTMAPYAEDLEVPRKIFRRLREISRELRERFPEATELSMGMSQDYEAAIEEGATFLRLGTAIFGRRQYL